MNSHVTQYVRFENPCWQCSQSVPNVCCSETAVLQCAQSVANVCRASAVRRPVGGEGVRLEHSSATLPHEPEAGRQEGRKAGRQEGRKVGR